jgi:hypothetical protein
MQILGIANSYASAPVNAPTSLSAIPTDTNVAISFTPPSNDGGASIINYEYSFNNSTWAALSPADALSPVTVSSLSANTSYSIYLRAVNIVGSGPASSAVSFTTDFSTFGSVEYLSIDGGATGVLNGGNHGTWRQGSQTLFSGSGIVVTVGAAGSASTCGNMSAATVYSFGKGSDGAGDYNLGHNGSGGGGGAGGTGGNGSGNQGGNGGPGRSTSITGSAVTYAGGGGGQSHRNGGGVGVATGGSGGGGNGEVYNYGCSAAATAGAANSGSGGGGGHECGYGAGGSGRVIIAYPSAYGALTTIPAGLIYSLSTVSRAGYHVYSFTGGTGTVIP